MDKTAHALYYTATVQSPLGAADIGKNSHNLFLWSKKKEYLWLANNTTAYGSINDTRYAMTMNYYTSKFYFKNNNKSANDYFVWVGKVKTEIPARMRLGSVVTDYDNITEWFNGLQAEQQAIKTGGGTSVTAIADWDNQYEFSPKSIILSNHYIKWSRPKRRRLEPGAEMHMRIKLGRLEGPWQSIDTNVGVSYVHPNLTDNTTAEGTTDTVLAYKGDTVWWIMVRGAIANSSDTGYGGTTLTQRADTDGIRTVHAKYTWAPTASSRGKDYQWYDNLAGETAFTAHLDTEMENT